MEGKGAMYDVGSDVKRIFSEEFKEYVRKDNLLCREWSSIFGTGIFVFMKEHEPADVVTLAYRQLALWFGNSSPAPGVCMVQFWRAEEEENSFDGERRFLLTTSKQPFVLYKFYSGPFGEGLCRYRMKTHDAIISTGNGGGGVIGRVFRNNRMEFTPNVAYYSDKEYLDRGMAISCKIERSLVVPLSDSSGRSVGVIEFVSVQGARSMPLESFIFERHSVEPSKGLKWLDCCKDLCGQHDLSSSSLQYAVSEINEVLEVVQTREKPCGILYGHTWLLCKQCKSLSTSQRLDEKLDASYHKSFRKGHDFSMAESRFVFQMGEGVVGKAAELSHDLVYCEDVTKFSITKYPLAHFAQECGLSACFAICLRSDHDEDQVYVLEVFLDSSHVKGMDLRTMLVPKLDAMRQTFKTFKVASGREEIGAGLPVQVIGANFPDTSETLKISGEDSIDNHTEKMDFIDHGNSVVNTTTEERDFFPPQNFSGVISSDKRGESSVGVWDTESLQKDVCLDDFTIGNWEYMVSNETENAQTSAHEPISELPNVVIGASKKCIVNSSNLANRRKGIDIRREELMGLSGLKSKDAAKKLKAKRNFFPPQDFSGVISSDKRGELPNVVIGASKKCIVNSPNRRKGIDIRREELMELSGLKRKDAAIKLDVSVSTFKRICNDYDIGRWPPRKTNKDHQSFSSDSAQIVSKEELSKTLVTINTKYGDKTIKFKLFASSGIDAFHNEVWKRLKLEAKDYNIYYHDENNVLISVLCDDDIWTYISSSTPLGKNTLDMSIEPI